jgi:hypothetical protein
MSVLEVFLSILIKDFSWMPLILFLLLYIEAEIEKHFNYKYNS